MTCWCLDANVEQAKKHLFAAFECKAEGVLTEYVGSKISITQLASGLKTVKFTQPVLVQKLKDEFLQETSGAFPKTPAVAGLVLIKGDGSGALNPE